MAIRGRFFSAWRLVLVLLSGFWLVPVAHAQSDGASAAVSSSGRARIALFELAGQKSDAALTAVLNTVADSVELSLDVLQRYDVRRLPAADPEKDLARVKSYCQANRMDQAIMGSGSAKAEGGYLFKLVVYDRKSDSITLAPEGSSVGALDMFDATDKLVGTLLDGLSGTHLLFGSLSVETDPAGATVSVNGKEVGAAPVSLRGLPAEAVQVSAKLAGYEDVNNSVTITDGESTDASMKLTRSTGTLALTVPKDAVVTVSSTEIGKKDLPGPGAATLPTGNYDVQATSPGMPSVTEKITIVRGTSTAYLPWPKGYLDIQAVPAGATITVDGVERGVAPLVVDVDPRAPHHVELKRERYERYVTDVSAAAGDKTQLTPALVGLPGSIHVETSIAGANVQLDNGPSGKTPFLFEKVQPGQHLVRIANLRVGNSLFVAGDPAPVEVAPGETTLLSKTLVAGKAVLSIKDAPPGSVIQIDGNDVDSQKATTSGIDVTAGWMDIAVQSPTSQKWTGSTFVSPGATNAVSVYSMTWQIPVVYSMSWMMPKHSNNPQDWAGLTPIWTSVPTHRDWGDQPGTLISRGFACRDDNYLYFKYEFSNGSPRKKLSTGLKELDYVQVIYTKAGEFTVIVKFIQSSFGTSQKIVLGIKDEQKLSWASLPDDKTAYTIGESTLEVAVPLDLVRRYVKGEPAQTGIAIVDSYDPGRNGTLAFGYGMQQRAIDFGQ
jgi:hypothetical protein